MSTAVTRQHWFEPAAGPACFHCGAALPAKTSIAGNGRDFCCEGCAAASDWIRDAGLDDYYRLRTDFASRATAGDDDLSVWDRPELLGEHSRAVPGGQELTLLTDGMRCAACAWLIDRALSREAGVVDVTANAVTGRIRLAWNPAQVPLSALLARLQSLGYRPYLATGTERERVLRSERNQWLLRLGVAGLGAMQAMMFAEALYLDTTGSMPVPTRDFLRWITLLIATPVVFYAGWPFIAGAWRELVHRRLGMDTLVAASMLLAYVASAVATVRGSPHVWFDAAVMFVFLLLSARMLEQRVRRVAGAQVDTLARARPAFATRETADGRRESIAVSAFRVGDIACVAAGELVPVDGQLLDQPARVEEALLTGESTPVLRHPGEMLFAGSLSREGSLRLRVSAVGSATRLAELTRLVERAQAHRPQIADLADRIAGRFVATLLLVAALVYLGWRMTAPERALEVTLALLIISCPCALSLAVPAALAAAHGALARLGVLALTPDATGRLARVTDVVFDKTGTLTGGTPVLVETAPLAQLSAEAARAIAAALERDNRHPVAAAFTPYDTGLPISATRNWPGAGIEAAVQGARWRLGTAPFAAGRPDDGAIWLGDGSAAVARFMLSEQVRTGASEAIDALRSRGLTLHLASGDAADKVGHCATVLAIPHFRARQTPEDKLAYVRALQRDGRVVAMVGDGINDAPVLAAADVAIAIGSGATLAHRSADLVLTGASLTRIPAALALSRRLESIIRQNVGWAIAYNLVAVPLAAAGLVTPWVAALGMALSSLTVTLNALRLTRHEAAAPTPPLARARDHA